MKTRPLLLALLAASSYAQTGTFTPTGNMTAPRFNHTATLLPDGKVLIAGGFTTCYIGGPCLGPDHAELYDPATGTSTATTAHAAGGFLLTDGRFLLIAGSGGVEFYDPSTGEFTAGKPATLASVSIATLLSNGRVLLIGTVGSSGPPVYGAQLYDPVSETFSQIANWPDARMSPSWYPVVLADDKVLLAPYDSTSGCEIYDPATGTFNLTGVLWYFEGPPDRTLLLNGAVLFTGGSDWYGNINRAKLYDSLTGTFAATQSMSTPRDGHSATLLPDGTVLVAGGAGQGVCPLLSFCTYPRLASAEIYDPATSGFSNTGSLVSARIYHTATLLNNGQVLITGGEAFAGCSQSCVGTPINVMSSAELYTPAVLVPAPELFTLSGDGKGQGAIWHAQTGQIATADNPAAAGEALSMYTTSLTEGSVITPQVIVSGRLAQVLYHGAAPGYPGYYQVNFVVPAGVPTGPAVPVRLAYLGRWSNAVTIGAQ